MSAHLWARLDRQESLGAAYSVLRLDGDGMQALRALFPSGEADDMNFVLFSTSGVHGTYSTIEDFERTRHLPDTDEEKVPDVTFVVVQPRIVCIRYGNVVPETDDDIAFLKGLRQSSQKAVRTIGVPT